MAGFGVHHRDDPLGGHGLGDAHAAGVIVLNVLGRDHPQQLDLACQGGVALRAAKLRYFLGIGEQLVHQCRPFSR